jgi:hypothetical protein
MFSRAWWLAKCAAWDQCAPFAPLIIALLVFGTAGIGAWYYPRSVRQTPSLKEAVEFLFPEMQSNLTFSVTEVTPAQKSRLQDQATHISNRANHHFKMMQYYYSNYYVSLFLGSVYGGLAAISLFLLTRAGWEASGRCLRSFFLATTVCGIFFFAFAAWCEMDQNATKNKALYVRYLGLLTDARTFVAINDYDRDLKATNAVTFNQFILHLDSEMKKANDIAVAFDATKGPIYNIAAGKGDK